MFAQPPHGGAPNGNMPEIGIVKGKIFDSQTQKPVEYATVALIRVKDSAIVNGTTTTAAGLFEMKDLKFGKYRIRIGFVGYKNKIVDSIFIYPKQTTVDLGQIFIDNASTNLSEVKIKAENDMLITGIDKKIYNVEKNLVASGGSATDVLQNIPSVNVDMDGNVTMRGSGNLTILIDGKPSGMVAASKSQALEQIPASSIQSIEIITNPSAKYDPEGMSGIINIILKKNLKQGLNGTVQGSAGTGDKYNTSLNLGYRNSKVNLSGSYSYMNNQSKGWSNSKRYNTGSDTLSWYQQKGQSFGHRASHVGKLGADFYLSSTNSLGATAVVSIMDATPHGNTKYYTFDNSIDNNPISLSKRIDSEISKSNSTDLALSYKHTFKKPDQTFNADVQYTLDRENEDNYFNTKIYDPATEYELLIPETKEIDYGTDNEKVLNVQADYVHPLKNPDSKIEAGYRSVFKTLDNDLKIDNFNSTTSEWITNTNFSNHFIYNTQIHAAYGTYSNAIKKLSYQAGLRLEQALSEFEMKNTNETFSKDYFSFFPTMHVAYKPNESRQWQLSYTRRVNRPESESINPFHHITDPLNVRVGNPKIDPEYINAYEISYLNIWKKYTLTSSIFYRKVNDMISRYKVSFNDSTMLQYAPNLYDANNDSTTLTTFLNYSNSQSYGFEFIALASPFKFLRLNGNFSIYESVVNGDNVEAAMNSNSFNWTARVNATIILPKSLSFQLSGNYMSPMKGPQGTFIMGFGMDGAIKKEIMDGKGTIGFRVSDILDSRKMHMEMVGNGFSQESERRRDSRAFFINFSYKFGKMDKNDRKAKRQEERDSQPMDDGM